MRSSALLAAPLVLPLLFAADPAGHAPPLQEGSGGDEPAVATTVGADRLAAGWEVTVEDSVAGDLMAAAGDVSVPGGVGGDLLMVGGQLSASGPVGGSVRAAGVQVTIAGPVARNVTLAGGSVRLRSDSRVGGNAYVTGGEVRVDGEVGGQLRGSADLVRIRGSVDGSVEVSAERVVVGPDARVGGDLVHHSPAPAEIADGATVVGEVTHRPREAESPLAGWPRQLLKVLAFLLTGAVLVALLPGPFERLREGLQAHPWPAMGMGLASLVLVPLVLLLVGVTVVGLPLMLIGTGLFLASLYVARAVVAIWLGRKVLGAGGGRGRGVLAFLLGGAVLVLLGQLPWIGWAITLVATLAGFGAAMELITRSWRRPEGAAGRPPAA